MADDDVTLAASGPERKRIAIGDEDGVVQIYITDIDELLKIAGSRVTQRLTAEEKR